MKKRELSNEEKQQLFKQLAEWEMNPVNQQKIVSFGQALVFKTALLKAEKSTKVEADLAQLTVDLKTFLPFDFEKNQFDVVEFQKDYYQAALTEEGLDFSKALAYKAPIMFLAQLTKSIMCTHTSEGIEYMPPKIQDEPTAQKLVDLEFDSDQFIEAPPIDYTVIITNKSGDITSSTCRVHFKAQLLNVYSVEQEASHSISLSLEFVDGLQPDYYKEGELSNFWRQINKAATRNAQAPKIG